MRAAKGLSQEAVALEAHSTRAYVSNIETGDFSPTVDFLDKLALALDVDVAEFLAKPPAGETEAPPIPRGKSRKAIDWPDQF
jgi:transcriptional regulator with XRE-family HTH domain